MISLDILLNTLPEMVITVGGMFLVLIIIIVVVFLVLSSILWLFVPFIIIRIHRVLKDSNEQLFLANNALMGVTRNLQEGSLARRLAEAEDDVVDLDDDPEIEIIELDKGETDEGQTD